VAGGRRLRLRPRRDTFRFFFCRLWLRRAPSVGDLMLLGDSVAPRLVLVSRCGAARYVMLAYR
jgi:hypothetical protein